MQDQTIEFVNPNKIPKILECIFCTDFCNQAVRLRCGHVFCEECINQWFKNKGQKMCPVDRKILQPLKKEVYQPDILVRNILNEFEVYCPNKKLGCLYTTKKMSMIDHFNKCNVVDKRLSQEQLDMFQLDRSQFKTQNEYEKQLEQNEFMLNFCIEGNNKKKVNKKDKFLEAILGQDDYRDETLINDLLQEDLDIIEQEEQIQNKKIEKQNVNKNKKNKKRRYQKKNDQVNYQDNNQHFNTIERYFATKDNDLINYSSIQQTNLFQRNQNQYSLFQRFDTVYNFENQNSQQQQKSIRGTFNSFKKSNSFFKKLNPTMQRLTQIKNMFNEDQPQLFRGLFNHNIRSIPLYDQQPISNFDNLLNRINYRINTQKDKKKKKDKQKKSKSQNKKKNNNKKKVNKKKQKQRNNSVTSQQQNEQTNQYKQFTIKQNQKYYL